MLKELWRINLEGTSPYRDSSLRMVFMSMTCWYTWAAAITPYISLRNAAASSTDIYRMCVTQLLLHIPPDSLGHHLIKVYGPFCTLPWSCWTLPPIGDVFTMPLNFTLQQTVFASMRENWTVGAWNAAEPEWWLPPCCAPLHCRALLKSDGPQLYSVGLGLQSASESDQPLLSSSAITAMDLWVCSSG